MIGGGRPKKPAAVSKLQGNPGKRSYGPIEAKARILRKTPPVPGHLGEVAAGKWRELAPLLVEVGMLAATDLDALASYCSIWSDVMAAEADIAERGLIVNGDKDNLVRNPSHTIKMQALAALKPYMDRFGLNPASRLTVSQAAKGQNVNDGLDPLADGAEARPAGLGGFVGNHPELAAARRH